MVKLNTADHPMQGLMVSDGKTISILESIIAKWSFVNLSKTLSYRQGYESIQRRSKRAFIQNREDAFQHFERQHP